MSKLQGRLETCATEQEHRRLVDPLDARRRLTGKTLEASCFQC
jgi:hypothetical protein